MCLVTQLCPTRCEPMDCSPPGSSVHGIFQARIMEWVTISFSRGSSQPWDQTCVSCCLQNCRQILYLLSLRNDYLKGSRLFNWKSKDVTEDFEDTEKISLSHQKTLIFKKHSNHNSKHKHIQEIISSWQQFFYESGNTYKVAFWGLVDELSGIWSLPKGSLKTSLLWSSVSFLKTKLCCIDYLLIFPFSCQ